jgi:hypothetical protein
MSDADALHARSNLIDPPLQETKFQACWSWLTDSKLQSLMRRFTALGRFAAKLARLGLVLLIAVFILLGILYLSFGRLLQAAQESLRSHPAPMADYAAALRRFQQKSRARLSTRTRRSPVMWVS